MFSFKIEFILASIQNNFRDLKRNCSPNPYLQNFFTQMLNTQILFLSKKYYTSESWINYQNCILLPYNYSHFENLLIKVDEKAK